jgi:hypothetical protein
MAVYLGNVGLVALQRSGATSYSSTLDVADVNVAQKRFSFDFPNGTFITGDYIQLTRTGGGNLTFIDASGFTPAGQAPSGAWYVNVDPIGGIRLYSSYGDSLMGGISNAITLQSPGVSYPITATVSGASFRTLGEVTNYELSTSRESLDVTALGDEFVNQVSGLISGSGNMSCFWDFGENSELESAQYIHQLVLRQKIGSNFKAAFVLKRSGESASTGPQKSDSAQLYYEIEGLITNVGISFTASDAVESLIDFVTTGEILLRYGDGSSIVGSLLLQEDGSAIDLESGTGRLLQDEP